MNDAILAAMDILVNHRVKFAIRWAKASSTSSLGSVVFILVQRIFSGNARG